MIVHEHTVEIDRPVEEVFAYVADPTNEPNWHHDVREVHRPWEGPLHQGATLTWKIKLATLKDYLVEVTAFEPNRRIQITTREGPVKPVLTHRFEPSGNTTRYTRRVEIPPQGWFRILQPLLKVMPNPPNTRWARNLKRILETDS